MSRISLADSHCEILKNSLEFTTEVMMEEAQAQAHMQAHQRVDLGQP